VIPRALGIAAVLAGGGGTAAALYWAFLNTPESNVLTLALSVFLVVATVIVTAVSVNAAVLLARGLPLREALAAGARGTGWFLLATVPLVLAWIAIARFDRWVADHTGEINAWFIARFGWADVSALFQTETWASRWLRWAVVPAAGLSLLASLLRSEPVPRTRWIRRAWHWRTLLVATLVFVLLFALPWQLTAWRPALPPTWISPVVAAARLGVAFALAAAGAAVLVLVSVRDRTS
jgi:hypothetical protein